MAAHALITDNPTTVANQRSSDADSPHPDTPASDHAIAKHSTSDAVPQAVPFTPAATGSALGETRAEPPQLFLPACGALCDILWWARRTP